MRKRINLNDGWTFYRDGAAPVQVSVPHTWNNLDGQDGGSDYWRGRCRYMRALPEICLKDGERAYVEFEGVYGAAEVLMGETCVARSTCGFSTFRADVTEQLKEGALLTVYADNSPNETTYPQFADFTFCGGIYREVSLVIVPRRHFRMDDCGGPGVRVLARVEDGNGIVDADALLEEQPGRTVRMALLDAQGGVAAQTEFAAPKGTLRIDKPHLWDGIRDPYLYTLRMTLLEGGEICDELELKIGLRSYSVDPDKGFFLNGRPYPLHGVSRHQDRENKGWAISRADHEEDMALIREVGANTIRLAHYQHAPYFYDLCDQYGMIVWAEIPYISRHLPGGRENTVLQMERLVLQNLHRPSVVCWGLSNEITMNGVTDDLMENHRILNDLCHKLDPTRLTTMACVSMLETDSPLLDVPDILSYNHYFGWYGGDVADNGPWLDEFHEKHPKICLGLSEYGCEGILRWHSEKPKMGDYSEEYQAHYHEQMLKTFGERPYLWSTHVWNMFDFGSDMRDEGGVKGRNNKGLVTYDRKTKKDSFFAYKAYWSDEPFVHICGKRFIDRPGESTQIRVYSNQKRVELYCGGRLIAAQEGGKAFVFEVKLRRFGKTHIRAAAGGCTDEAAFHRVKKPNPAYSLENAPGAAVNWFDRDGKPCELQYPEGCFSIRDSLEDIMQNEQGRAMMEAMIQKIMAEMGGAGMTLNEQTMKMMKGFTLERIVRMAGKRIEPHQVVELNEALNRIRKN